MATASEAALLDRVPRKLLHDYNMAWSKYQSACLTGGTDEQRKFAYQHASSMERKLHAAVLSVRELEKRAQKRKMAKATHA